MTSRWKAIGNGPPTRRARLSAEARSPNACPSPCAEGDAFGTYEGGGRNATGLARQWQRSMRPTTSELSPMAFLGGGVSSRMRPVTPTRCVQRLGSAVVRAALSAMADPSRGRIALPPLHDEGNAFVIGGGEGASPVSASHNACGLFATRRHAPRTHRSILPRLHPTPNPSPSRGGGSRRHSRRWSSATWRGSVRASRGGAS
jgi:hypothetical protein